MPQPPHIRCRCHSFLSYHSYTLPLTPSSSYPCRTATTTSDPNPGPSPSLSFPTKSNPTPFDIFSLPRMSSPPPKSLLKKRYYQLARKYHPDSAVSKQQLAEISGKGGGGGGARTKLEEELRRKFELISTAYQLLSNQGKCDLYLKTGYGWDTSSLRASGSSSSSGGQSSFYTSGWRPGQWGRPHFGTAEDNDWKKESWRRSERTYPSGWYDWRGFEENNRSSRSTSGPSAAGGSSSSQRFGGKAGPGMHEGKGSRSYESDEESFRRQRGWGEPLEYTWESFASSSRSKGSVSGTNMDNSTLFFLLFCGSVALYSTQFLRLSPGTRFAKRQERERQRETTDEGGGNDWENSGGILASDSSLWRSLQEWGTRWKGGILVPGGDMDAYFDDSKNSNSSTNVLGLPKTNMVDQTGGKPLRARAMSTSSLAKDDSTQSDISSSQPISTSSSSPDPRLAPYWSTSRHAQARERVHAKASKSLEEARDRAWKRVKIDQEKEKGKGTDGDRNGEEGWEQWRAGIRHHASQARLSRLSNSEDETPTDRLSPSPSLSPNDDSREQMNAALVVYGNGKDRRKMKVEKGGVE